MWNDIIDKILSEAMKVAYPGEEIRIRLLAERAKNGDQKALETLKTVALRDTNHF